MSPSQPALFLFCSCNVAISLVVLSAAQKKMQGVKDALEADQRQIDQRRGCSTLKLEEVQPAAVL